MTNKIKSIDAGKARFSSQQIHDLLIAEFWAADNTFFISEACEEFKKLADAMGYIITKNEDQEDDR